MNGKEFLLLSVEYDGGKGKAVLKLLDVEKNEVVRIDDYTGHKPYCLTNKSSEEILNDERITKHPGFLGVEEVEKYDLLHDRKVKMRKIIAKDPRSIGGRRTSLREIIGETWESRITYVLSYIYDTGFEPGVFYKIEDGELRRVDYEIPREVRQIIDKLGKKRGGEYQEYLYQWIRQLMQPTPDIKRVAVDIEVVTEKINRVPDPREASQPVIAIAFCSSKKGESKIFLLERREREDFKLYFDDEEVEVKYYRSESDLLREAFEEMKRYPLVLTFNGDSFDLNYLYHRALKLGFSKDEINIRLGEDTADLKDGVHIDLYRFLFNKSVQTYAYGNSYKEVTLDAVGRAIVGLGKKEIDEETSIGELSDQKLAEYCFRDAEITCKLSTVHNNLLLKLLLLFTRISRMPIEQVARHSVSAWIRSLFYYEHRRRNYLIPRPEDITRVKGGTYTKGVIKGKKYLGAMVLEPVPGIHFNVIVMDFASLYPSVIMQFNLSYETVRCPHEECKENKVPGTPHWICRKRKGMASMLIGSLRDLRVNLYRPLSKRKDLSDEERIFYNVNQRAIKVFLNASYGVMGSEAFTLYCPPMAESVTMIGRRLLTEVIERASELGVKVIYGDTDSVFLKNPSEEQIKELSSWVSNKYGIDLTVDKEYRYVVLSERKKNYLGVFRDGTPDVKGLVGKKSSTPLFVKKAFFELLKILSEVKSEEEFEHAKEEIRNYIREVVEKIKKKEIKIEELAFNVMMSKKIEDYTTLPQHVKAAKMLQQIGREVKEGEIISYVKTVDGNGVKPIELARPEEIDADKYLTILKTTFQQVLEPLGIEIEEKRIRRLVDFM
ncbi:MAG TPA: DNA-directed DNA polymerase I [Candidatus Bathyarchaeota archaeon]|nr:DNA-directed DNA polymerase I [Candidatus Bathyarchaeota archaeon]